jgi:hypothetical protein
MATIPLTATESERALHRDLHRSREPGIRHLGPLSRQVEVDTERSTGRNGRWAAELAVAQ